jgi:penicillin-binding protein 1A
MSNKTTEKMMGWLNLAQQKIKGFWPWYKGLYQGRAWYVKTLVGIASLVVAFFLYLGAVDMNFLWLFGKSP